MKNGIRFIFGFFLAASLATVSRADDISSQIQANLNQAALDGLARDLGALMGGGSFHQGRSLGFPVGFDVGVHVPVIQVKNQNPILKGTRSTVGAVWGQAEVGLPLNIDVIGRGGKILDATLVGGGLRYGILKPSIPGIPAISVSALYSHLNHDMIDLTTISGNLVASFDIPFIHPYIGGGIDHTTLKPTDSAFSGVSPTISRSLEGKANGYRAEVGLNISVIPFTYLTLGGGLANGNSMYHAGLGVKF